MHRRGFNHSRIFFFVLVFISLAFLVSAFFISNSNSNQLNDISAPILTSKEEIIPTRIKIPSIEVNALIKPVGLTENKTMQAPKGPADTVWFTLGPSPGEIGSAVIAGHRGWKIGPAVFDDLDKIKLGDKVYVEGANGDALTFIVREMRVYYANEIVPEVWNKTDGTYLNLITCSGGWNILTRTSNKRLVVFTELAT